MRVVRLALATAMLAMAGCYSVPDSFTCTNDDQCDTGDPDDVGLCELAVGRCSVLANPGECPSTRVYAPYSGDLSNQCVPELDAGTVTPLDGAARDLGAPDLADHD